MRNEYDGQGDQLVKEDKNGVLKRRRLLGENINIITGFTVLTGETELTSYLDVGIR